MKIKCPFWDDCYFEDEEDKFFVHLAEHHYGEIKHELWRILTKIHEKIESLQNRMNALDRTHGIYEETEYQKYKEYQFELKSLLENK